MMSDPPMFGDVFKQYFNPDTEAYEIRARSRGPGLALSLSEIMEYIDFFLKRHQTSYIPHRDDPSLIVFPYMFIAPRPGDRIMNDVTKEVYTVDQVLRNPKTNKWEGAVRLNLHTPPSVEERHFLILENQDRYVKFDHIYPSAIQNPIDSNIEGVQKNTPPLSPTITWRISRIEPGSMGGQAFGSRKELKPRFKETVKDPLVPGYSVQVSAQSFDNLVDFDCWSNDTRTSERLVRWFENFMKTYSEYLQQCGVDQLFFWQRSNDDIDKTWRQVFAVKTTQFYFRTQEIEAYYERDILNINITIESSTGITPRLFTENRYIADQLVTGELTYDEYRSLFCRSGEYLFGNIDIIQ